MANEEESVRGRAILRLGRESDVENVRSGFGYVRTKSESLISLPDTSLIEKYML